MKRRTKILIIVFTLIILSFISFQVYWYSRLGCCNVSLSSCNGTGTDSLKIALYVDGEFLSEEIHRNHMVAGIQFHRLKLSPGFHTLEAKAMNGAVYGKVKFFIGISYVKWIRFELLSELKESVLDGIIVSEFDSNPIDFDDESLYEYVFSEELSPIPLMIH